MAIHEYIIYESGCVDAWMRIFIYKYNWNTNIHVHLHVHMYTGGLIFSVCLSVNVCDCDSELENKIYTLQSIII